MGLQIGEVNRTHVVAIAVLVAGGGAYGWWSYLYTPAVTARTAAVVQRDAAQAQLKGNQDKLEQAKTAVENTPVRDDRRSIAETMVSKLAIPHETNDISALNQVEEFALRAGIKVISGDISAEKAGNAAKDSTATQQTAAKPIVIDGYGTYRELAVFTKSLQDTAYIYKGQVYVRTRLMAVTALTIDDGAELRKKAEAEVGTAPTTTGEKAPRLNAGEVHFAITIEYYSDPEKAGGGAAAVASTTPATGAAAGTPGTPGAAAGSPAAANPATGATSTPTSPTPSTTTAAGGAPSGTA